MPKSKQFKVETVERLVAELSGAKSFVLTNFKGLTVKDVEALRSAAADNGVRYEVVKRTLLKRVFAALSITLDLAHLPGEIALASAGSDEVASPKVLWEFAKTHESLKPLAGWANGAGLSAAELKALAELPTRPVLLGIVVGTIAAPLSGFVRVLSSTLRSVVLALAAVRDKRTQS